MYIEPEYSSIWGPTLGLTSLNLNQNDTANKIAGMTTAIVHTHLNIAHRFFTPHDTQRRARAFARALRMVSQGSLSVALRGSPW